MACAQTGSGKTAAFLIPTCSALFSQAKQLITRPGGGYEARHFKARPLVLILAPTRELCCQIFDEARRVSVFDMLHTHLCLINLSSDFFFFFFFFFFELVLLS
jgi:ATP-dependent RNA helicase DDX3X